MVGILAQVDDIFSWAPRGGKLIGTGWGMRIQGHGYLNILCRCTRCCKKWVQRECGFQLDQHYKTTLLPRLVTPAKVPDMAAQLQGMFGTPWGFVLAKIKFLTVGSRRNGHPQI